MKEEFNLSEKRERLLKDIEYLFGKIDWGHSFLDAQAIEIMNNLRKRIMDDDAEFIRLLKEELHKKVPTLRDGWKMIIDREINKLAGEKFQ